MPELQERVTDVEYHLAQLAHAQLKTELALQELARDLAEYKAEGAASRERLERAMAEYQSREAAARERSEKAMAEDKATEAAARERSERAMAEYKAKEAAARERSERAMEEYKAKEAAARERSERAMEEYKREAAEERRKMNKAWGDLANKMGTIIEDIVAPNIRRLAEERFRCEPLERFLVRPIVRGRDRVAREFDVVAVGGGKVVLAESKSTITAEAVAQFAEKVRTFFEHFPEWRGQELIAVMASWSVPDPARQALTAARIYGLEMGDDTMRLVNDGEF